MEEIPTPIKIGVGMTESILSMGAGFLFRHFHAGTKIPLLPHNKQLSPRTEHSEVRGLIFL